ncbi:hypothetical protein Bra471DRAFT_00039 [Bradyrhizobium sp. WSM471]|nr:hypothetical protein Bra471DRAFT_00039 [Bradyrhizobium sp. WSM471]
MGHNRRSQQKSSYGYALDHGKYGTPIRKKSRLTEDSLGSLSLLSDESEWNVVYMRAPSHGCFCPAERAGDLVWSAARRRHRQQSLMLFRRPASQQRIT